MKALLSQTQTHSHTWPNKSENGIMSGRRRKQSKKAEWIPFISMTHHAKLQCDWNVSLSQICTVIGLARPKDILKTLNEFTENIFQQMHFAAVWSQANTTFQHSLHSFKCAIVHFNVKRTTTETTKQRRPHIVDVIIHALTIYSMNFMLFGPSNGWWII